MFPHFDPPVPSARQLAKAVAASPGAAVGKVVFDSHTAEEWANNGER
jgi:pyruvate, orthophosphate dikinase